MTKTVATCASIVLALAAAGCGTLRRPSPEEAKAEAALAELKRLCGTTTLAVAPRRLEAGLAPQPNDCRGLLQRAGAL